MKFRETTLQSNDDNEYMNSLTKYIQNSSADDFNKFDNFTKYVPRTALSRFLARYEIFKQQVDVPGVIFDLGVGRGASLMSWAQLSAIFEPVNYTRSVVGFDTFEGIPHVDDKDSARNSSLVENGGFKTEDDIFDDIQTAISVYDQNRYLNHIPKVSLVKGDICETLPAYIEENPHTLISLVNIDVDLYKPTKTALEYCLPRMPKGAIILFDELNTKVYPGETIATLELLEINNLELKRFHWSTTIAYAQV